MTKESEKPAELEKRHSTVGSDKVAQNKVKHEADSDLKAGRLNQKVQADQHEHKVSGRSRITGVGKTADGKGGLASATSLLGGPAEQEALRKSTQTPRQKNEHLLKEAHMANEAGLMLGTGGKYVKPEHSVVATPEHSESKGQSREKAEKSVSFQQTATEQQRLAQLDLAASRMIHTASERFGADKISAMHIAKGDVGTAISAMLLGPDVCKAMGPDETRNFGKRLIVFGVAPMLGMAEEASKQVKEHPMETAHEGSSNFLIGTAIGAMLEKVHPLVMGATAIGAGGLFLHDQFSTPEHQERNGKISAIASKIGGSTNADLLHFADQSKKLLGPDLYKGAFVVATGGIGLPQGKGVSAAIDEQVAHGLPKVDMKAVFADLAKMSQDTWRELGAMWGASHLQPSLVGAGSFDAAVSAVSHNAEKQGSSALDYMLAMVKHNFEKPNRQDLVKAEREFLESDVCKAEVKRQLSYNEQLQKHLASLASKPFEERVSGLKAASRILLKFEKPAEKGAGVPEVINAMHASALAETDKLFQAQVKALRGDLEAMKPKVEAIEKQSAALSDAQQKILDRYYAGEDAIGEMVSERLVSRFGMKDKQYKMVDLGVDSGGFDVQRKGANMLTCIMDSEPKLNRNGVSEGLKAAHKTFLAALKEHGVSAERLNGFVSIPMAKHSAADEVGCDCLLVNKHTGEYYAIDFTSNIEGPASRKLFSSKVLDSDFRLGPGKNVPSDRIDTVIGVAGAEEEKAIRAAISNANPALPAHKIDELVTQEEQKQLAEIIAKTISNKSKLNILETPLPSGLTDGTFSRMAYECRRFGAALENVGYSQWKNSINGVAKFLQGQAIECSNMPKEIYNRSVVKLFPWASEWR